MIKPSQKNLWDQSQLLRPTFESFPPPKNSVRTPAMEFRLNQFDLEEETGAKYIEAMDRISPKSYQSEGDNDIPLGQTTSINHGYYHLLYSIMM